MHNIGCHNGNLFEVEIICKNSSLLLPNPCSITYLVICKVIVVVVPATLLYGQGAWYPRYNHILSNSAGKATFLNARKHLIWLQLL